MNISFPMPQRLLALLDGHHADHLVAMLGTLAATVFSTLLMLADSEPLSPEAQEVRLLLMPMIGALVGATGAYLLSPKEEPRKLAGRSIYSVAIGTALPVTFGMVSDYGKAMSTHPVALFLAGIIGTTIVFAVIKPLITKLHSRSSGLADEVLDAGERALRLPKRKEDKE